MCLALRKTVDHLMFVDRHCEGPADVDATATGDMVTSTVTDAAASTTGTDDHDHDHDEEHTDDGELGPSPTESVGW